MLLNQFTLGILTGLRGLIDSKMEMSEKQESCGHPRSSQYKHGNKFGTGMYCRRCGLRISWVPRARGEAKAKEKPAACGRSSAELTDVSGVPSLLSAPAPKQAVQKTAKPTAKPKPRLAPMYETSIVNTSDSNEFSEDEADHGQNGFEQVDGASKRGEGTDDEDM